MKIGEFILRRRLPLGTALLAGTLLMGLGASRIHSGTQFINLFPSNHPNVQLYERYHKFGGLETVIIMLQVKHGDIFNTDTLNRLRNLTHEADWLPGVNHMEVFSLASFRVGYTQAVPGGLIARPYMYPNVPETAAQLAALKKTVFANRGALAHLISADNRSALVTAALNDEGLDYGALYRRLHQMVAENGDANHVIYLSGEPVIRSYAYHYLPQIIAVFAAACLIIVAALYLILGVYTCWWVPLVTGLLAALWGLGFMGLMDYTFDPLMLVVPFILTARNLGHAIQWQRHYYRTLNRLEDRHAACVAAANEMLVPGLVAITADVAGIVFISFSGIPVLEQLARTGTVWLAASAWMVFLFQPIAMSCLRVSVRAGGAWHGVAVRRLTDFWEGICELPVTPGWHRKLLLGGALLFLVAGTATALSMPVGYNSPGTPLYRSTAKVNTDTAAITRNFPIDEGWLIITSPPFPDPQSVLSPRVLRLLDRLHDFLMKDGTVPQVISFAGIVNGLDQRFNNNHPKFFGVPASIHLSGNLWAMLRGGSAPGEMEQFFTSNKAADTCIRIMLRDHTRQTLSGVQHTIATFENRYLTNNPAFSQVQFHYLGGIAGLYAAANDVLYRTTLMNLAMVLTCVFIFCTLLFGSLRTGAMLVFSCVLANVAAFICMRLSGMSLTIDTVPVISLAIGLGVDYAIATVTSIRAEAAKGFDPDDAIRMALRNTGESVLCTVSVMMASLLPWLFSPALFHQHMAALLAVLIATNALAGTIILPAFISWSRFRFITPYEPTPEREPKMITPVAATAT
jgi:predicted RND superfamily exporter protein